MVESDLGIMGGKQAHEFMLEAGRRKIPLLNLDTEELKQEIDFALGE